jgi:hypothetical protein
MSANGKAERDAAHALLLSVSGADRAFRGIPDESVLARDPDFGSVLPYIVERFGRPIPAPYDRNLGTEDKQPHIMAITLACYAEVEKDAEDLAADITDLLLGLQLTPNSSGLKSAGGYSFNKKETQNKPSRYLEPVMFTTIVNL